MRSDGFSRQHDALLSVRLGQQLRRPAACSGARRTSVLGPADLVDGWVVAAHLIAFFGLQLTLLPPTRPILRHQSWRIHPGFLDKRLLEPIVSEVCVFSDDELEARHQRLGEVQKNLEQPLGGH